jgi:uncharacterized protein (UPF0264 family)
MSDLLVSVRSVEEAQIALRAGAGLIDIKEPALGSLGRAHDDILCSIARSVGDRRPISAALGELLDHLYLPPDEFLGQARFVKFGLSGCATATRQSWTEVLYRIQGELIGQGHDCRVAAAAYADWQRANAPSPDQVCACACERKLGALLIDTWRKDGSGLLDWISVQELWSMRRRCREAGVPMALAGSIGAVEIRELLALSPDWFAVRGAACQRGDRSGRVDSRRVRGLAALVRERLTPAIGAG